MPISSIDTLLACSVMVVLVLSSMLGILKVAHPYLQNQPSEYGLEVNRRLAECLLLDTGDPPNWGSGANISMVRFGLAKANSTIPFELDIDKITRLNQENAYHVSFTQVFKTLGAPDKPIRIEIGPIIDVRLNLASQINEGNHTAYGFDVYTKKSNSPVLASLHYYSILGDYVVNGTSSTSPSGAALVEVALPNSLNGTALLIVFAKVEPRIVSYGLYPFKHNSSDTLYPIGTFVKLSPLNYILTVELLYVGEEIVSAKVFTYNYYFDLAKVSDYPESESYAIPHLLDVSPMVLVVTGLNESKSFAEWVSHPQLPVDFGPNLTEGHDVMNSVSFQFLIGVNSVIYECKILVGEGREDAYRQAWPY